MTDSETSTTTTTTSGQPASGEEERCALELRAETINLVAVKRAERRGVSDRLEIGKESASDTATGHEEVNVEGNYRLEGRDIETSASIVKRTFRGRLNLRLYSDTLMLSGAVSETFAGVVTSGAGMCDVLGAAGGLRVTTSGDFRLINGLAGMEEKPGTSINDKLLLEIAATSFQREYGVASYKAAFASYSGEKLLSMEAGTWSMLKASLGFRQQIKGQAKLKSGRTAMRPNPGMAPAADPGLSAAVRLGLLTGIGIGKGVGKGIARSKNLLDVDSAAKAAANAVDFAPTPPVRSSSLGFFKKNRVFIQDEIVPAAREAMQNSANFGEELRRVSEPPPASTLQPIEPSPPATTLQPPEADSSYLHRTSTANGAPEGLLSTADNSTVMYRSESTATLTDDLATEFNIRYSQLNPELLDPNLNIIPTSPINKSSNLPSLDVIQPKSVSNQSIGVYELLDTATIAAKTDSTYSTPSSIQLLRQNHNQSRYLPSIPSGLEIGPSQLKAGSGAAQESTEGFGGARRATQYDASGSTSPRPRLSQEGAGWVSPGISRPNSGAYDTVGFQIPSPYHSTTALNKIDSIEDLDQFSDSRRSSIVETDDPIYDVPRQQDPIYDVPRQQDRIYEEIPGQQIFNAHDEQAFQIENAATYKTGLNQQDESITAAKLDMYRQSQKWDFHNGIINHVKKRNGVRSKESIGIFEYIADARAIDNANSDVITEIKKIGSKRIGSKKITPDKINKRINIEKKKLNKLRKALENNKEKWNLIERTNKGIEITSQELKIKVYENFNNDFSKFISNNTQQQFPNYSPNYSAFEFHRQVDSYSRTTPNITSNQRILINQGLDMVKKGDDPVAAFRKLVPDDNTIASYGGAHKVTYSQKDINSVIGLFQGWFTKAKHEPSNNIQDILDNLTSRLLYLDTYFPSSIDNAAKVDDDLYSQIKTIEGPVKQQDEAFGSTDDLSENPYEYIIENSPDNGRNPSQLSDNNAFTEVDQARIPSDPNSNATHAASSIETSLVSRADELLSANVDSNDITELHKLIGDINEALNNPDISKNVKSNLSHQKAAIDKRLDDTLESISQNYPYRTLNASDEIEDEAFTTASTLEDVSLSDTIASSVNRAIVEQHKSLEESLYPWRVRQGAVAAIDSNAIYLSPAEQLRRLRQHRESVANQRASLIASAESPPYVARLEDLVDATTNQELAVLPKNLAPIAPDSVPVTQPVQLNRTKPGTRSFNNPQASVVKLDAPNATDGTLGNLTNKGQSYKTASVVSETDETKPVLHNPSFKPADRPRYDFLAEPDAIDSARDLNYRDGPTIVQKIEFKRKFPRELALPGGAGKGKPKGKKGKDAGKAKGAGKGEEDKIISSVTPASQQENSLNNAELFETHNELVIDPAKYEDVSRKDDFDTIDLFEMTQSSSQKQPKEGHRGIEQRIGNLFRSKKKSTKKVRASGASELPTTRGTLLEREVRVPSIPSEHPARVILRDTINKLREGFSTSEDPKIYIKNVQSDLKKRYDESNSLSDKQAFSYINNQLNDYLDSYRDVKGQRISEPLPQEKLATSESSNARITNQKTEVSGNQGLAVQPRHRHQDRDLISEKKRYHAPRKFMSDSEKKHYVGEDLPNQGFSREEHSKIIKQSELPEESIEHLRQVEENTLGDTGEQRIPELPPQKKSADATSEPSDARITTKQTEMFDNQEQLVEQPQLTLEENGFMGDSEKKHYVDSHNRMVSAEEPKAKELNTQVRGDGAEVEVDDIRQTVDNQAAMKKPLSTGTAIELSILPQTEVPQVPKKTNKVLQLVKQFEEIYAPVPKQKPTPPKISPKPRLEGRPAAGKREFDMAVEAPDAFQTKKPAMLNTEIASVNEPPVLHKTNPSEAELNVHDKDLYVGEDLLNQGFSHEVPSEIIKQNELPEEGIDHLHQVEGNTYGDAGEQGIPELPPQKKSADATSEPSDTKIATQKTEMSGHQEQLVEKHQLTLDENEFMVDSEGKRYYVEEPNAKELNTQARGDGAEVEVDDIRQAVTDQAAFTRGEGIKTVHQEGRNNVLGAGKVVPSGGEDKGGSSLGDMLRDRNKGYDNLEATYKKGGKQLPEKYRHERAAYKKALLGEEGDEAAALGAIKKYIDENLSDGSSARTKKHLTGILHNLPADVKVADELPASPQQFANVYNTTDNLAGSAAKGSQPKALQVTKKPASVSRLEATDSGSQRSIFPRGVFDKAAAQKRLDTITKEKQKYLLIDEADLTKELKKEYDAVLYEEHVLETLRNNYTVLGESYLRNFIETEHVDNTIDAALYNKLNSYLDSYKQAISAKNKEHLHNIAKVILKDSKTKCIEAVVEFGNMKKPTSVPKKSPAELKIMEEKVTELSYEVKLRRDIFEVLDKVGDYSDMKIFDDLVDSELKKLGKTTEEVAVMKVAIDDYKKGCNFDDYQVLPQPRSYETEGNSVIKYSLDDANEIRKEFIKSIRRDITKSDENINNEIQTYFSHKMNIQNKINLEYESIQTHISDETAVANLKKSIQSLEKELSKMNKKADEKFTRELSIYDGKKAALEFFSNINRNNYTTFRKFEVQVHKKLMELKGNISDTAYIELEDGIIKLKNKYLRYIMIGPTDPLPYRSKPPGWVYKFKVKELRSNKPIVSDKAKKITKSALAEHSLHGKFHKRQAEGVDDK